MTVRVDDVIATYMKLRNEKEAIEAEIKSQVAGLKAKMDKIEAWLKEQADAQGVTSFKGKHGTAFLTTTDYANVADWDAVLEFVKTNEAFDMLEKRVSKIAVRGYIERNKSVPAGVTYGTKIDVTVRKPTMKVED
jgi:multidrug efflux pump subunit AcrB